MGLSEPKIWLAVVRPMTQTLFALRTSCGVKIAPSLKRPFPDIEIVRRLAVDAGEPVLIAGRDLTRLK